MNIREQTIGRIRPKITEPNEVLVIEQESGITKFCRDIIYGIWDKVTDVVKGCINHLGGIIGLSAMTVGFAYLIGELPFLYLLPAFVESAMFAPVLAVICVLALGWFMSWQSRHQLA